MLPVLPGPPVDTAGHEHLLSNVVDLFLEGVVLDRFEDDNKCDRGTGSFQGGRCLFMGGLFQVDTIDGEDLVTDP